MRFSSSFCRRSFYPDNENGGCARISFVIKTRCKCQVARALSELVHIVKITKRRLSVLALPQEKEIDCLCGLFLLFLLLFSFTHYHVLGEYFRVDNVSYFHVSIVSTQNESFDVEIYATHLTLI